MSTLRSRSTVATYAAIVDERRRDLGRRLRRALDRYRGGRFETGESGGAGGMMFFIDERGSRWYIGGMGIEHAQTVTDALNLVLEILADSKR
jgi:hypothetical protein